MVQDDAGMLAFKDISAKGVVHVLVVPSEYVSCLTQAERLPGAVSKGIFEMSQRVAVKKMEVAESGYTFKINNGPDSGQELFHLHTHAMGGKR